MKNRYVKHSYLYYVRLIPMGHWNQPYTIKVVVLYVLIFHLIVHSQHFVMFSVRLLASQAKHINHYKNLRVKVLNCCASIYFKRKCIKQNIVPKYAGINIPNTSPALAHWNQPYTINVVVLDVLIFHFIVHSQHFVMFFVKLLELL